MLTIKHGRASFTVKPENAQAVYDILAIIDKSKGKRGPKLPKRTDPKYSSIRRDYPSFYVGMTTADYVSGYEGLNARLCLKGSAYTHADRAAPTLDPRFPEVVAEVEA